MAKCDLFDDDFDFDDDLVFNKVPDMESVKSKVGKLEEECGKFAKEEIHQVHLKNMEIVTAETQFTEDCVAKIKYYTKTDVLGRAIWKAPQSFSEFGSGRQAAILQRVLQ